MPDLHLGQPVAVTRWWCEECSATSTIGHKPDAGVYEVRNLIEDAHRADAPKCHRLNGLDGVRAGAKHRADRRLWEAARADKAGVAAERDRYREALRRLEVELQQQGVISEKVGRAIIDRALSDAYVPLDRAVALFADSGAIHHGKHAGRRPGAVIAEELGPDA